MATEFKLPYTGQEISNKLGKVDEAVRYTSQTLTDAQKSQARANIGAMDEEAIENLVVTAIANANELTNISATFEEIYEAYNAGRNISLHIQTPSGTTTMLPCTSIDADSAFFDAVSSIAGQNTIHSVIISSDDTSMYVSSLIDGGGGGVVEETDPTVPSWAKQPNKPTYTASEVGALPSTTVIPTVPTKVSAFTNDAGYAKTADLGSLATKDTVAKTDLASAVQTSLGKADTALQSYTETDPTVPSWAKASSKPSYTKSEVGLGNVDNVKQYSASNPPPYPVTSVNGKTGAVTLSNETWTFTLADGSTVTKKVVLA